MKVLLKEKYDSDFHSVLNRWNYNSLIDAVTAFDADVAAALSCLSPDSNSKDTVDEYRKAAVVEALFGKLPRRGVPGQVEVPIGIGDDNVDITAQLAAIRALNNYLILGFYMVSPFAETNGILSIGDDDIVYLVNPTGDENSVLFVNYTYDEELPADFPACDCNRYAVSCSNVSVVTPPLD